MRKFLKENASSIMAVCAIIAVLGGGMAWLLSAIEQSKNEINANMARLEERVGRRLDGFDKRLDSFEKRLDGFEKRLDDFGRRLDGFDRRLGSIEEHLRKDDAISEAAAQGSDAPESGGGTSTRG